MCAIWIDGQCYSFGTVVAGSISSGEDPGIHYWWDLIRSTQLSSVSIWGAQVFARFSGHDNSIHNIIPLFEKNKNVLSNTNILIWTKTGAFRYHYVTLTSVICLHTVKWSNSSIWHINRTLTSANTSRWSWPGSNGDEEILQILKAPVCPVGRGSRIHRLLLCREVRLWIWY